MTEQEKQRLIELLIKEVEQLHKCENTSFLNLEESKELDNLLNKYKND